MNISERKFTSLVSPYDVRDYKIACISTQEFPEEFVLDNVTVKDQGGTGSCVAHACSSIVEYHNKKQEKNDTVFSTEFIYGHRPTGYYIGEGMYVRDALKTLKRYGDVPLSDLIGNNEYDVAMKNVNDNINDLKDKAYPHRISSYMNLRGMMDIKTALMKYGYVLSSMPWHANATLKNGVYSHNTDEIIGYHAVVIYGWNANGWLVQNSWGENWGQGGRFIVPFDFEWTETWSITDNIINEEDVIKPNESNIFINLFYRIINFFGNIFNKK
jgi:hypothetical protein